MRFAALPWLEVPLQQALRHARGHALLIHGPRGVGQFDLAGALAAAWLCEDQPKGGERGTACGSCASCALIAAGTHPDLRVLVPAALQSQLGLSGDEEPTDADIEGKRKAPSKDIRIDAVRDAIAFAQRTSSRGGVKVIVIYPAERMNSASASALLKTLEEPPGAARLILASAAPQRLLPTVRSRCQSLRLALPEIEVAAAWLAGDGRAVDAPQVLLAAAGGQPLDALDRLTLGVDAATWRSLPADVLAGRSTALAGWPLATAIDALLKLCHDALCVAVGAAPRYFPADIVPRGGDPVRLGICGRELLAAARSSEHSWNASLAVEAHVLRVQRALQRTGQGLQAAGRGVALATLSS
jgi:DNA polymerase III subunit delta'